jgi:hypothetical protein
MLATAAPSGPVSIPCRGATGSGGVWWHGAGLAQPVSGRDAEAMARLPAHLIACFNPFMKEERSRQREALRQ